MRCVWPSPPVHTSLLVCNKAQGLDTLHNQNQMPALLQTWPKLHNPNLQEIWVFHIRVFIILDIYILIVMFLADPHQKKNPPKEKKRSFYSNLAESTAIGVGQMQGQLLSIRNYLCKTHAAAHGSLGSCTEVLRGSPPTVFSSFWLLLLFWKVRDRFLCHNIVQPLSL